MTNQAFLALVCCPLLACTDGSRSTEVGPDASAQQDAAADQGSLASPPMSLPTDGRPDAGNGWSDDAPDSAERGRADGPPADGPPTWDVGLPEVALRDSNSDLRPSSGPLGPMEVSVLFPLPARLRSPNTVRLDTKGAYGLLLPKARFNAIDAFQSSNPGAAMSLAYDRFHIVALRFDPCFPALSDLQRAPQNCRRQIRLVAQPLEDSPGQGGTQAVDSAIHLMYDLDGASFDKVISRLVEIQRGRPPELGVLGINPTIAREGDGGPTATALRNLILEHVGDDRLTQFTFMRGQAFFEWRFGGFKVQKDKQTPLPIAGIPDATQAIFSGGGAANLQPETAVSRDLRPLFGEVSATCTGKPGCETIDLVASPAAIRLALQTALDVENPWKRHAETVDCASCHLAAPLRMRALGLGRSVEGLDAYESTWNLGLGNAPDLVGKTNLVRAFGYFDKRPLLAQRTVNESAAVADAINGMLAKRKYGSGAGGRSAKRGMSALSPVKVDGQALSH